LTTSTENQGVRNALREKGKRGKGGASNWDGKKKKKAISSEHPYNRERDKAPFNPFKRCGGSRIRFEEKRQQEKADQK